ncbi:MAG: WbqC family protein [Balneolales bacterium]|nr:WbqC family protein [Balneolales bacterium]
MSEITRSLPSPVFGCLVPALFPDLEHLSVILNTQHTYYLTDEPFSRKSKAHRALIRTVNSTQWLTLPVEPADKKKPLSQVRIKSEAGWPAFFLKALQTSYGNSRYFDFYQPEIESDLNHAAQLPSLTAAIQYLNMRLFCYLEAGTFWQDKTSWINTREFDLIKANQAAACTPALLIEQRGSYYRKPGRTDGIQIHEAAFALPVYRQITDDFHPSCCLLDVLFQYGPYSYQVVDQLKKRTTGI